MNDRQLRHFVVLGELLNFHQAAERLNIVQPALSTSIKRLEEEFDVQLFERSTRHVSLTAAGQAALEEARNALRHLDQAIKNAKSASNGSLGHLKIGFVGSASYSLLPLGVRAFRTKFPDVVLSLQESAGSRILSLIEQGEMDLGLVRTPAVFSPNVVLEPLESDQLVAVLPSEGRWTVPANARSVSLARLAHAPFVNYSHAESPMLHMAVIRACQEAGFSPNIVQEAIQVQTVITLVESGLGVGLVPSVSRHHKPSNARFVSLSHPTPACMTGLAIAYIPSRLNAASRNFLDMMTRIVGSTKRGGRH